VYKLRDDPDYDPVDKAAAFRKTQEWGEHIPIGIIYRTETMPAYEEQVPALKAGALVKQPLRTKTLEEYETLKQEFL
jgi:2-oxoglutarate ferredoxin oxidoreductase subunit beta